MHRAVTLGLVLLLAACASTGAVAPLPSPEPAATAAAAAATATAVAAELASLRFDQARGRFGEKVAAALSTETLAQQWSAMTDHLGAFRRVRLLREEPRPEGARAVVVECEYEQDSLALLVVVDAGQRVIGLRPAPAHVPGAFEEVGREFLDLLVAGEWTKATARFDEQMTRLVPEERLAASFEAFCAENGERRAPVAAQVSPRGAGAVVDLEYAWSKRNAKVRVALDKRLRVEGYFFLPAWNAPDYADPSRFEEREVTVGTPRFPLPATLTLPRGEGPFPALVLVHGSGPADRDESSGPNKLFKDLAWGLAGRGVAVLRFEKRTRHYQGKLSGADVPTVKEESIDDALTAIARLAKTPGIDPKRLFVAGHSLGASLAPRIARADPRVHGIVLLAGSTRTDGQVHLDQHRYLAPLWVDSKEQQEQIVREAEEIAHRLDSPGLKPEDSVLGVPGTYWLDQRANPGHTLAAGLVLPILVLQGERDYQITMEDYAGWQKALGGRPNATFKSYPKLNHHFMPGEGPSTPREYATPNHAPLEVIEDLARWLLES